MTKNEKKLENSLIKALNSVCEQLKQDYQGFAWLTHFVDYRDFPQSLKIVFVFKDKQHLKEAQNQQLFKTVFQLSESHLKRESIHIKRIEKAVYFDTEENGADFDSIKWCRKYN